MSMEITWNITVSVPEIAIWGEKIVERLQGIQDQLVALTTAQADGSDAIAAQLTVIADEIGQLNAGAITDEQLTQIEAQIRQAADLATQQAADIRSNSQQISTIVPDAPPPA